MAKQLIVTRTDLKLGKGKLAAHVAHASLEGYKKVKSKNPQIIEEWESEGQKKVVVKIESERELLELFEKIKNKIPCALIKDAGLTQIPPGTITALAIGPWDEKEIDEFTRHLKLL
ncbi:MAG: peptidyl-tRNA hydrolase Pth2 [Candidatus Micrarchaeota archaeon]|nr:peptidyl-tRNA hydrolase Pth2 [Candidatus Micrarchaeota archaeon]